MSTKTKPSILVAVLAALTFSKKFQPRAELNKEALAEYTEAAKEAKAKGAESPFPPLKAIKRGDDFIVYSGFHRGNALKAAGFDETKCEIEENDTITDLEVFQRAIHENATNGARITNADKLHNFNRVLKELGSAAKEVPNTQLAEYSGVTESFVRNHRPAAATGSVVKSKTGKKINTKNIGKKGGKAPKPAKEPKGKKGATGEPKTPTTKPATEELAGRDLTRIASVLGTEGNGPAVKAAILDGTLPLTVKQIANWAGLSDNLLKQARYLIVEKRWEPSKAIAFLDSEVTETTRVAELILHAILQPKAAKFIVGDHTIRVEKNA